MKPRTSIPLVALLLALMLLASVQLASRRAVAADRVIDLCNIGNTTLFVAMLVQTPAGGLSMDGWHAIAVGSCRRTNVSYRSELGFAVADATGRKRAQVYDRAQFPKAELYPIERSYCVDPQRDFHRDGDDFEDFMTCRPGEMLARFAFQAKPCSGGPLTLRIPADKDGDVLPFVDPSSVSSETPFQVALRGLAEQQARLGAGMEQRDLSPVAPWPAYFLRDLGIVIQPATHIVAVAAGSPASQAGIRRRDEIVRIDSTRIKSAWHARSLLVRTKPGETHTISYLRGGALFDVEVELAQLPDDLAATDLHPRRGWLGLEFEGAARVAGIIHRDNGAQLALADEIQRIGGVEFDGVDGLAQWLAGDRDHPTAILQVRRPATGKIFALQVDKLQ